MIRKIGKPPKSLNTMLCDLARQAHEEELSRALSALAESFDDWRSGKIDCDELNTIIHKFHQRTAREIFERYDTGDHRALVASAVAAGILDLQQLPNELVDDMERLIAFFEVAAVKEQLASVAASAIRICGK